MSDSRKFIGIDLGAESGRCVVAIFDNEKIKLDEIHRFTTHSYKRDNEYHWDIKKIFDDILTGIKKSSI